MNEKVPSQLEARFSHHGMEVGFKARTPREARVVTAAMMMGVVLPMLPMGVLMAVGAWWPEYTMAAFSPVMVGVFLVLGIQVFVSPAVFQWAGKPAQVELVLDDRSVSWSREGEKTRFELATLEAVEAMAGEIRIEGPEGVHRLPCAGLKKPAVSWLEARIQESWQRRKEAFDENPLQRAERRKLGKLTERDG